MYRKNLKDATGHQGKGLRWAGTVVEKESLHQQIQEGMIVSWIDPPSEPKQKYP